jgi:predicted patatin/cPLA2 family phospholipase
MRNITLSADEYLIESARQKARTQKTTLNAEFRKWLRQYTKTANEGRQRVQAYRQLMQDLSGISTSGQKFSRDEMSERR